MYTIYMYMQYTCIQIITVYQRICLYICKCMYTRTRIHIFLLEAKASEASQKLQGPCTRIWFAPMETYFFFVVPKSNIMKELRSTCTDFVFRLGSSTRAEGHSDNGKTSRKVRPSSFVRRF